ncbi:hypothetical protein C8R48DRAFT_772332 [Suillus tomentosus]|nr:hypothetical protein C8R48DRAFT_772332 [Suillus tomentosus]
MKCSSLSSLLPQHRYYSHLPFTCLEVRIGIIHLYGTLLGASRELHPRALYTLFSLSSEFWDVRSSRKGASYLLNNSQHSRLALAAHFHESLSW